MRHPKLGTLIPEREFWGRAIKSVFEEEPNWQYLVRRRLEAIQ